MQDSCIITGSIEVLECLGYEGDARLCPLLAETILACAKLVKVPRIFLNTALKGCVSWAKENDVELINEKDMDFLNDKRAKEKQDKN